MIHGIKCTFTFIPLSINIKTSIKLILMSVLHHDEILEDCYERAYEQFRIHNKLNQEQMQELILHKGVEDAIIKSARKMFDDMCQ